jgi:hypothetical protein
MLEGTSKDWQNLPDSGKLNKNSEHPRLTIFPHTSTLMGADYYKLLGIDRSAGDDDIKKAYKKMV